MIMSKINIVIDYLDELFPNPHTELEFNKDYELLIAVVLSAHTTDKKVNKATSIMFKKYPSLEDLMNAPIEEIEDILKPIGMYHKKSLFVKKIAEYLHNNCNDIVPNDRKILEGLSGVGRKTANVVLSLLFNEPYIAVDTHVARVSKRLEFASDKDIPLEIEKKLTKLIPNEKLARSHYQLVLFGRYNCTAINPKCDNCKINNICKYEKKH
jgi:endonuclease-3